MMRNRTSLRDTLSQPASPFASDEDRDNNGVSEGNNHSNNSAANNSVSTTREHTAAIGS
jgi:hypothetical protein